MSSMARPSHQAAPPATGVSCGEAVFFKVKKSYCHVPPTVVYNEEVATVNSACLTKDQDHLLESTEAPAAVDVRIDNMVQSVCEVGVTAHECNDSVCKGKSRATDPGPDCTSNEHFDMPEGHPTPDVDNATLCDHALKTNDVPDQGPYAAMSHCNLKNPGSLRTLVVNVIRHSCEVCPSNNVCNTRKMLRVALGLGHSTLVSATEGTYGRQPYMSIEDTQPIMPRVTYGTCTGHVFVEPPDEQFAMPKVLRKQCTCRIKGPHQAPPIHGKYSAKLMPCHYCPVVHDTPTITVLGTSSLSTLTSVNVMPSTAGGSLYGPPVIEAETQVRVVLSTTIPVTTHQMPPTSVSSMITPEHKYTYRVQKRCSAINSPIPLTPTPSHTFTMAVVSPSKADRALMQYVANAISDEAT